MKPFFVYMLHCSDGSYYVGHTDDLEKRVLEHQHGAFSGYTSTRRPVELVWSAEMGTRDEALLAEMQIKGWSRAKKVALIRGDWVEIVRLSGPRTGPDLRRPASNRAVRPSTGSGRTERPARPEPEPPVRPEPEPPVRPESESPVRPESESPVRPEPVEGRSEGAVRPSTGSGRTVR